MTNIDTDLKRWTIYDCEKEKFFELSDNDFNLGLISNYIQLSGKYINKIWVDGLIK